MKAILASLAGMPGDHAALKIAALVAKAHDAHVDALHVYMGIKTVEAAIGGYASTTRERLTAMSGRLAREEGERRANAHAVYDQVCLRQGLATATVSQKGNRPSAAFVDVDSLAIAETARRARYYDLTVMARESQLLPSRITSVLMESGRPLLLAPPNPRDGVGMNIAIAWKPSAEAARAVTAVTPFLAKSARVTIFVVPESGQSQADAAASARPLQATLAWHGAQAHIVTTEAARDAGAALREAVYAREADLLVAGGYGHNRLREMVLGGVTRSLLAECDIPLLLAH